MSELKEHLFCDCNEMFLECVSLSNEMRPYYLKSEADKVIAELEKKLQDYCAYCPVKEQEDDVVSELEEERRWRKFPEEKPKWGEEVLVVDDESKQYIVRFSHDMKWISWGKMNTCESNCVKYWMPLPSAPKEAK